MSEPHLLVVSLADSYYLHHSKELTLKVLLKLLDLDLFAFVSERVVYLSVCAKEVQAAW